MYDEQCNIHILITSVQKVYILVKPYYFSTPMMTEMWGYIHPCVFCVRWGFMSRLITTLHMEVKVKIVIIEKELKPGGNGIY